MRLNLHSRLAQRVLVQLSHTPYRSENDLYEAAQRRRLGDLVHRPRESFKIEVTAQHSPLKSLNFAALKIKDAVADRFRNKRGERPNVDTQWPDVRIYAHLTSDSATLYIDTSGEPLFKRGWREDKGEAPLKETLAAAMIAASGWDATDAAVRPLLRQRHHRHRGRPGGLQYRAGPVAPLRLRKAAALPGPCVEGAVGRGQGAAAAGRARRCSAATSPSAWSTSRSAMPTAPVWPTRCNCAAATRCSACRPPTRPA